MPFSDGLGFSGVYIAVDIGIKSNEESKTSVVDVFELSKNLRRDRHGIVCALEHYNFIYQVIYNWLLMSHFGSSVLAITHDFAT